MAIKLKQLDTTVTCADSRNTVDKRRYVLCRQFWQNQNKFIDKKNTNHPANTLRQAQISQ